MKRMQAEYPYDDYYLYKVHHKKENRNYAILIPIDGNKNLYRTTLSYARYLMSVKLKRFLLPEEQIDHIDNDKTNDSIENLQILTKKQNNVKEALRHNKKILVYKCPNCGKIFYREYKNRNIYKNYKTICCSRQCSGKFQWKIKQNFSIDIEDKIKNNLIDIIEVPYTTSLNKSS